MNLRTKLESKEGKWVRVHFPDSSYLTGRLQTVGSDFVQLECYGRDDANLNDPNSYTQHLIPLSLVKLITVEASSFIEAERRRLEYVSKNSSAYNDEYGHYNIPDLEK
ncbi:MAG: hypothetical protein SFU25_08420 [Candidatus Caenarcaniphilales bacterium]|nr:hypothetical protein [Candidatus Caenarcaniphilales bacterium]